MDRSLVEKTRAMLDAYSQATPTKFDGRWCIVFDGNKLPGWTLWNEIGGRPAGVAYEKTSGFQAYFFDTKEQAEEKRLDVIRRARDFIENGSEYRPD